MPTPTEMPLTDRYSVADDTWKFTRDPAEGWPLSRPPAIGAFSYPHV